MYLVYGLGVPLRSIAGTGVLFLLATAMAGTAVYARASFVHQNVSAHLSKYKPD